MLVPITEADESSCGSSAIKLMTISQQTGITSLERHCIPVDEFVIQFWKDKSILRHICKAIDDRSNAVHDFIDQTFDIPSELVAAVISKFQEKDIRNVSFLPSINLAAQRTNTEIDSESVLNVDVSDKLAVSAAIRKIWASAYNELVAYHRDDGARTLENCSKNIAVIVQECNQRIQYSFTAYTRDPCHDDSVFIEIAPGHG